MMPLCDRGGPKFTKKGAHGEQERELLFFISFIATYFFLYDDSMNL